MDAYYYASELQRHTTGKLKRYARLEVPPGLYLLMAKAHVAVGLRQAEPPATEQSLAATALVRLSAGALRDEAFATIHGSWDSRINHATVNLMVAGEVGDGAVDLEAIGLGLHLPAISGVRLTALPLDAIHETGSGFRVEGTSVGALQRSVFAGFPPGP